MKRWIGWVPVLLAVLAFPVLADEGSDQGEEPLEGHLSYTPRGGLVVESSDGSFKFHLSNRVQFRYTYESPEVGDSKGSFRLRRFKFKMDGHAFTHWKYKLQVNFASGTVEGDNDSLLEDAVVKYTKHHWAQPFMGQAKTFFARQALTSSGKQEFVDRSIVTSGGGAEVARQIGIGLVGRDKKKRFEYNLGIYNGDGANSVNKKENENDEYLIVGRVVWTPFGEYKLDEVALDRPESSKLAVGIKGASDTLTRDFDPDDTGPLVPVSVDLDVVGFGAELAYKIHGFVLNAEWFTVDTDVPETGPGGMIDIVKVERALYYAQLGYLFRSNVEVAGRYAVIDPDVSGPSEQVTEAGVAVSYYIRGHDYKVQSDYRRIELDADPTRDTDEVRFQFQFVF